MLLMTKEITDYIYQQFMENHIDDGLVAFDASYICDLVDHKGTFDELYPEVCEELMKHPGVLNVEYDPRYGYLDVSVHNFRKEHTGHKYKLTIKLDRFLQEKLDFLADDMHCSSKGETVRRLIENEYMHRAACKIE